MMTDLGFVDDFDLPPISFGAVKAAVSDALKKGGWFEPRNKMVPQPLAEALCERVARLLHGWAERSGKVDDDWDAMSDALAGSRQSSIFILDPRLELCSMLCRVAGLGVQGRSFAKAAESVGLVLSDRAEGELRDLASWMRDMDREHLGDRDLPGWAGLLFERVQRWPFCVDGRPDVDSPEFRQDLERYRELTNLDISRVFHRLEVQGGGPDGLQPQHFGTWLRVFGLPVASQWFDGCIQQEPHPSVRAVVLLAAEQMRAGLIDWLRMSGHQVNDFVAAGVEFQEVASAVFAALVEHSYDPDENEPFMRLSRFGVHSPAVIRMWFARASYGGRSDHMPADIAKQWLRLLKQEMGSIRAALGEEDVLSEGAEARAMDLRKQLCLGEVISPGGRLLSQHRIEVAEWKCDASLLMPSELFERDREHFLACADQVFQLEGLWEGMRQLLLAMRALKSPCVASDLRYWEEPGVAASDYPRQPEEPWRCIPVKLVASFHALVGKEEAKDLELKELRGQFAAHCLHGLRDKWNEKERAAAEASGRKRTNDDMVEPSPDWRYCRVRAAKMLAVNPEGRGHRLLLTASEIDPDPNVREVANDAYQSLRRGLALPEGMSPRRAVLGAFWWLRQAHLKELKIPIDRDGAQRTRIKELTRTKER